MTAFLQRSLEEGGRYASTQTGNFDLYLPFIEKGIELLSEQGHLGLIAPSLWTMNDYGEGLRECIMSGGNLWGWIDFGSYQVFDEATTYTALQFFSRTRNRSLSVVRAHDGDIPEEPWATDGGSLEYQRLAFGQRWLLTTGDDRELIDRIVERCLRLDDPRVTRQIFVGIQTSADEIYHLRKIGPGRYECAPRGREAPAPYEVQIEDEIMKPLVSGMEAKRYVEPRTDTYLLFPYRIDQQGAHLISAEAMANSFPNAWNYLSSCEAQLRRREGGKMNHDDRWWAYNYPKNLDKQQLENLIVAQTVPSLRLCNDSTAQLYLNNVRVNGIVPAPEVNAWYLLGIMNGKVCDFVFRRVAKPKDGGWFEANKQFIAPLPIPEADADTMQAVADQAQRLQALHTRRRDILDDIDHRRSVMRIRSKSEKWLFPDLPSLEDLEDQAPRTLDIEQRSNLARQRFDEELARRHDRLGERLSPGVELCAELTGGELRFLVDGVVVVDRVFVRDEEGPFIAAQWKVLAATIRVTASSNGKRLSSSLRRLAVAADNPEAARQIVEYERELEAIEGQIADAETEMNQLLYSLYGLDEDEVRRIEQG